ncbi:MAG: hypothetical protein DRJ01_13875, partial [Bacteroidetes bacterium]
DGKYGEAINIGENINTKEAELCVYVTPDGNTLYFSSKGHDVIGGFDIFKSEKINGTWTKAKNLGIPINTPNDDVYYVDYDTIAYYSTKKEGDSGIDIYLAKYEIVKESNVNTDTTLIASIDSTNIDNSTNPNLPDNAKDTIIIRNISFDINKYTNNKSYETLNILAAYLTENQNSLIDIFGYTDTQGNNSYNKTLSEKRATFVYNYLVNKGISKNRLTKKGKGEANQISKNKYPNGKYIWESLKYNRRVEIIVKQQGKQKIVVEQVIVPEKYKLK